MNDKYKFASSQRAKIVATRHAPIFYQNFGSPLDMPMRITFGDFIFPDRPTIYYAVKESTGHYYIYYLLYHYRDYSVFPPPIKEFDEHRHDMEGVMVCIEKHTKRTAWVASRAHYRIKVKNYRGRVDFIPCRDYFEIESGGHGIEPLNMYKKIEENMLILRHYDLDSIVKKQEVNPIFMRLCDRIYDESKVTAPWQWDDTAIKNKYGKKEETEGLIWNDPEHFLFLAKGVGITI